jgi:hypothetical protein
MTMTGKNEVLGEKPVITLPSTYLYSALTALGSSPGLRGEKPVTLTTPFQLQVVVVCGYEPHCVYRCVVNIHSVCVCVCVCGVGFRRYFHLIFILPTGTCPISDASHVSHLLFPSFVTNEI